MRRLLIVPIVHSQSDLGSLATSVANAKSLAIGSERASAVARNVAQFWQELTGTLQSMALDYDRILVYQDGLPVIENSALQLERTIVEDLARNGSPNHRLVKWFVDQGACLMGTESTQLLMKEYAAIRQSLAEGFPDDSQTATVASHRKPPENAGEEPLIDQRDRFIARRIADTLGNSQLGLLFIGMLHNVEQYLPDDITPEYPIGRPKFSRSALLNPQVQ